MKRILHLSIVALTSFMGLSSVAQDVYWREGFEGGGISTVNPTGSPAGPNDYYAASVNSDGWFLHNTYRTTGTPCLGPYAAYHLRILNISSAGPSDTASVALPPVTNGVSEIHFSRCRASGSTIRMSIWVRSDTIGNINVTNGTGWTRIAIIQPYTNINSDTTVIVPAPYNLTTKRVAFSSTQASNIDVDSIWLVSATPLPVKWAGISAAEFRGQVKVSWNIATEENVSKYVIERSLNGNSFEHVGEVAASKLSTYSWSDLSPANGVNYYRIKAVDMDGQLNFSKIVKVTIGKNAEIDIAPNPVKAGMINLQVGQLEKGSYSIRVFNNMGQQVFTQTIQHNGGVANYKLQLPATVKIGIYNLQMNSGSNVINKKIVVE